jgi:hypothetical protein
MKTLHFRSFKAKRAFIERNGISPQEIVKETPGSITGKFPMFFSNSSLVYDVTIH